MTQNPAVVQPAPIPVVVQNPASSPSEVYQALRAARSELRGQQSLLEDRRRSLVRQREQLSTQDPARNALEQRIADTDQRIAALDKQLASADAQVAAALAVPGSVVPPPTIVRQGPPEANVILPGLLIVFVLFPVSVAFARRLWRRGAAAVAQIPAELAERLTRIEQAIDAIAIEVERVGESQRYVTTLMRDGSGARALGAGAAEPVELKQREMSPHVRG